MRFAMRQHLVFPLLAVLIFSVLLDSQTAAPPQTMDWKAVEQALGLSGQVQPDGVMKFGLPRRDLQVSVQGFQVDAALALGSWLAFHRGGSEAMVMGDLVLLESEIAPVMAKLEESRIQITALHNHILGETPRIMYMHIAARGEAIQVASAIKSALALTGTPPATPGATTPDDKLGIDRQQIEAVLGRPGKVNGRVLQFAIPRSEKITEGAMEIPQSMGLATAINFQPSGEGRAAITGDFVLLAQEVNSVIRQLTQSGIAVTAVHNHMLDEQPRLFFLHYWANDDAVKLAKALRGALDLTGSSKPH